MAPAPVSVAFSTKVACPVQERAFGGLTEDTKRRIKKLQIKPPQKPGVRNAPPAGTELEREWGGERHRVLVLRDGFEYRGCKYTNLTAIATKITGTKRSGPLFFGLKG